ncbi:unnamed protein product [Amoebophrya sp. A120]|nr:unnamed protein product [Amoebophrya sp. A120]|eukprot:GSA120T00010725001.1
MTSSSTTGKASSTSWLPTATAAALSFGLLAATVAGTKFVLSKRRAKTLRARNQQARRTRKQKRTLILYGHAGGLSERLADRIARFLIRVTEEEKEQEDAEQQCKNNKSTTSSTRPRGDEHFSTSCSYFKNVTREQLPELFQVFEEAEAGDHQGATHANAALEDFFVTARMDAVDLEDMTQSFTDLIIVLATFDDGPPLAAMNLYEQIAEAANDFRFGKQTLKKLDTISVLALGDKNYGKELFCTAGVRIFRNLTEKLWSMDSGVVEEKISEEDDRTGGSTSSLTTGGASATLSATTSSSSFGTSTRKTRKLRLLDTAVFLDEEDRQRTKESLANFEKEVVEEFCLSDAALRELKEVRSKINKTGGGQQHLHQEKLLLCDVPLTVALGRDLAQGEDQQPLTKSAVQLNDERRAREQNQEQDACQQGTCGCKADSTSSAASKKYLKTATSPSTSATNSPRDDASSTRSTACCSSPNGSSCKDTTGHTHSTASTSGTTTSEVSQEPQDENVNESDAFTEYSESEFSSDEDDFLDQNKAKNKQNDDDLEDLDKDVGSCGPTVASTAGADKTATKKMLSKRQKENLTKEGYKVVGQHSAVKLCRWTKHHLRGRGGCYKHTFYGIASLSCMEATPSLACANKCVFCWRHHKNPVAQQWEWQMDEPELIVENWLNEHAKMIKQLKGVPGVTPERFEQAKQIKHCALSLVGEPIMYPKINKIFELLHKEKISTFMVTNAQFPEQMRNLSPCTQLYLSIDAPTKDTLKAVDRPLKQDFWQQFLDSIDVLRDFKFSRTVFRLTLVKNKNMDDTLDYAKLIKRGDPDFIEIKGVTYNGDSQGKDKMTMKSVPWHWEVVEFGKSILALENLEEDYELACEHEHSLIILLAKKTFKDRETGAWKTWIDYDKFHRLIETGEWKNCTSVDYSLATPKWGVSGAPEKGFDPADTRVFRKKKEKTAALDAAGESAAGTAGGATQK